ncbi:AAA domain-containing protein [Clostridium tarantellae]|uniref:AAA family ATPase n=1 Tax=Clostridium tarantellae TaxID=39493 RepID=A0A6I1MK17_9CLOT|nr:AAA domain-containing protein [Clostridium tarantellae]MPQ42512.1 AAA family ATPase [Clostridium tarantellae]
MRELNLGVRFTKLADSQISALLDNNTKINKVSKNILFRNIFESDKYYEFYLQNATRQNEEDTRVKLILATDSTNDLNKELIKKLSNRTILIEGVNVNKNTFLIIKLNLLGTDIGRDSNKGIGARITFNYFNSIRASAIPNDIINEIKEMPNTQELYRKVDKNIKDWDSYLEIIENNAAKTQLEIKYKGYNQGENLTYCTFLFDDFSKEEVEKLKKYRSERVILFYKTMEEDSDEVILVEDCIGTIEKINYSRKSIKIELYPEFQELAQQAKLAFPSKAYLRISKLGDLAQAKSLRRGLKQLKFGGAYNQDLDIMLFNPSYLESTRCKSIAINDNDLLLKTLNKKQRMAVEGVLNTNDIFLIQGPPGTGKTTVIAEICYQNAIRGKKTLIASQSNLAVDNALSRLVHNSNIRALRQGNLSRVEKEGEVYTESNVVNTWLSKTAKSCLEKLQVKKERLKVLKYINEKSIEIERAYVQYENKLSQEAVLLKELRYITENSPNKKSLNSIEQNFNIIKYIINDKNYNYSNEYIDEIIFNITNEFEKGKKVANISALDDILKKLNLLRMLLKEKLNIVDVKNELKRNIELVDDLSKVFYKKDFQQEIEYFNIKLGENISSTPIKKVKDIKNKIIEGERIIEVYNKYEEKIKFYHVKIKEIAKEFNLTIESNIFSSKDSHISTEELNEFFRNFNNVVNNKPNFIARMLGFDKEWKKGFFQCFYKTEELLNKIKIIKKTLNECFIKFNKDIVKEENNFKDSINNIKRKYETRYIIVEENFDNISEKLNIFEFINLKNISIDFFKKEILEPLDNTKGIRIRLENLKKDIKEVKCEIDEFNSYVNLNLGKYVDFDMVRNLSDKHKYYYNIIKTEITLLDKYVKILSEWTGRIEEGKYTGKQELKDLYIKNANVIGITCVQSGNRKFTEEYPNFDTVIVDEVSKATPPELILPMLKGKNIVLVGDHKQLPPMIGNETFEELQELMQKDKPTTTNDFFTEELEQEIALDEECNIEYMKKSLFEELYLTMDFNRKVMLDIQYRMHSSIMNTINQFYRDNNSNGLICGVENEDITKNHGINTRYINQNKKLLWVDIPLSREFFEEKNNNSYYNLTEIEVIEKIISDINKDCKINGKKKEVAVITFYGAQSKLLQNELINKNKFKNIKLRVGTVDRFQGIEREIVIVSFVRNNNNRQIGFARDPKRINVALSRAQSLLVVVGCSELFCEKNNVKNARDSYSNVLRVVNSYNGVIDAREVFN